MSCPFTNQTLAQLDLLRNRKEAKPEEKTLTGAEKSRHQGVAARGRRERAAARSPSCSSPPSVPCHAWLRKRIAVSFRLSSAPVGGWARSHRSRPCALADSAAESEGSSSASSPAALAFSFSAAFFLSAALRAASSCSFFLAAAGAAQRGGGVLAERCPKLDQHQLLQ